MVSALQAAVAVRRDEGEELDGGPRNRVGDESGGFGGDPAQAALLPAADDPADGVVVLHRSPRARERKPAAGALAAAGDRPDGRRTAARAERRDDHGQTVATPLAQLGAGAAAGEAALREEQIEQDPTLAGNLRRQRADFVANSARAASSCSGVPMSYHLPGSSQA